MLVAECGDGCVPIAVRGGARENPEPTVLGEGGDDVVGDSLGHVRLAGVGREVVEGQYREEGVAASLHGCLWCVEVSLVDGGDEHVAPSVDGADDALLPPGVTDCPAKGLDLGGEGRLADESPTPHRVEELVLGDHPARVPDELAEDAHREGFDGDDLTVAAELLAIQVQLASLEAQRHLITVAASIERCSGLLA